MVKKTNKQSSRSDDDNQQKVNSASLKCFNITFVFMWWEIKVKKGQKGYVGLHASKNSFEN